MQKIVDKLKEKELANIEKEMEILHSENERLKEECKKLTNEIKPLNLQNEKLQEENDNLTKTIAKLTDSTDEKKDAELEDVLSHNELLYSKIKELEQLLEGILQDFKGSDTDSEEVKKYIDSKEKELRDIKYDVKRKASLYKTKFATFNNFLNQLKRYKDTLLNQTFYSKIRQIKHVDGKTRNLSDEEIDSLLVFLQSLTQYIDHRLPIDNYIMMNSIQTEVAMLSSIIARRSGV